MLRNLGSLVEVRRVSNVAKINVALIEAKSVLRSQPCDGDLVPVVE
jgi:hypothetical protein